MGRSIRGASGGGTDSCGALKTGRSHRTSVRKECRIVPKVSVAAGVSSEAGMGWVRWMDLHDPTRRARMGAQHSLDSRPVHARRAEETPSKVGGETCFREVLKQRRGAKNRPLKLRVRPREEVQAFAGWSRGNRFKTWKRDERVHGVRDWMTPLLSTHPRPQLS